MQPTVLSRNHCSIEMRAIGLVAHVNANAAMIAVLAATMVGTIANPLLRPNHPNQESAPDREGDELKQ